MKRIVIVGGGVTGLSAALAAAEGARERQMPVAITVLEGSAKFGGNIRTDRVDGFTIDGGPDSWVSNKPQASALARSLGLGGDLMETLEANRRVYIAWDDKLHALPEGLVLAVPTQIRPMAESSLFSWAGKARMGMEPFVPKKTWNDDDDESIASFITRRLGQELCDRLAAPLLGGIFAGDADRISIRATFPQFVEAERQHGSLVMAMRAQRKAQLEKARSLAKAPSPFVSLKGGVGALVEALVERLEPLVTLRKETRVTGLDHLGDGEGARYRVALEGGAALLADAVLLAVPAHLTSKFVKSMDESMAQDLAGVEYVSSATMFYAFERSAVKHPLDATGFIVPRVTGRPILAGTWVSSKWAHRAPEGKVLMRVFFGGAWGEKTLEKSDDELAAIGLEQLKAFMGLEAKPLFHRGYRFQRANPQPIVGHPARLRRLRARLEAWPGLRIAASGLDGVGIPDCVRQGQEAATVLLQS
jgi:oxygen-dependent protoporphyrinogen oxidase